MRSSASLLFSLSVALAVVACGGGAPEEGRGGGRRGPGGPGGPGGRPGGSPAEGVLVRAEPLRLEPMAATYSTSATLRAEHVATVTARTRGVVEALLVEEGDRVAAERVLARLENDEQEIALERARANLENREWEFQRTQALYDQELVAEEAFEAARRETRDARQAVALAELELSRTEIRAPFSGVVVTRHLDLGNTVSDGTAVYTLADVSRLLADVNVPERHVARLTAGQSVRLSADATGIRVEAGIERIAPAVDPETGTVKVTLAVAGDDDLRPGSFVRADIVTATREEALVAPRAALVAEGRRWFVYEVAPAPPPGSEDGGAGPDEAARGPGDRGPGGGDRARPAGGPRDGGAERSQRGDSAWAGRPAGSPGLVARRVEVELGFEREELVEIRSLVDGALEPGDRVVVAGAGGLVDGAPIEVAAPDAEPEAASGEAEAGRP